MDLPNEIVRLRHQRGLTIRQLAEKTGYNKSNLSLIEQGKRRPRIDVLENILKALGAELTITEMEEGGN